MVDIHYDGRKIPGRKFDYSPHIHLNDNLKTSEEIEGIPVDLRVKLGVSYSAQNGHEFKCVNIDLSEGILVDPQLRLALGIAARRGVYDSYLVVPHINRNVGFNIRDIFGRDEDLRNSHGLSPRQIRRAAIAVVVNNQNTQRAIKGCKDLSDLLKNHKPK